jgi:hypothetical protein
MAKMRNPCFCTRVFSCGNYADHDLTAAVSPVSLEEVPAVANCPWIEMKAAA